VANIDAIKQRYIGRWQTGYARAGARLERELQSTSPVDTGEMRRQTRVFPRGPGALEVVVATDYASFVRDGTNPHVIEARPPRRALRFEVGGQVVFRRRVNHPGTNPNPWYNNALGRMPEFFNDEIRGLP